MVVEQRGRVNTGGFVNNLKKGGSMNTTKPFLIPKSLVWEAWLKVKANRGAAGVDQESLKDFEKNLQDNLYQLWNRMASGSYFPPPVKGVEIPKKSGGYRILGVPTVSS